MKTAWDNQWKNEADKTYWNTPDRHVIEFSDNNNIGKGDKVLDLGCGVGRHSIYLAQRGAFVYAIDESEVAIEKLKPESLSLNIDEAIQTKICDYLSFDAEAIFDYIIAFNVIYHGDVLHFKESISKCYEMLKPGGKLFFTCPSKSDAKYGSGEKIAEHTYESLNSIHPGDIHYFSDENELREMLKIFSDVRIIKDEYYWDNNGKSQFASNFIIVTEKGKGD